MKYLVGFLVALLVIVLLLAGAVWYGAQQAPGFITDKITAETDYVTAIESSSINPFTGSFALNGFSVQNPKDAFPEENFVRVREFSGKIDLPSLVGDRYIVDRATLAIEELAVVITEDSKINAREFYERIVPKGDQPEPDPDAQPIQYLVRDLMVAIDNIRVFDYRSGERQVREYPVNIEVNAQNVDQPQDAIMPVVNAISRSSAGFVATEFLMPALGNVDVEQYRQQAEAEAQKLKEEALGELDKFLGGGKKDEGTADGDGSGGGG